MILKSKKLHNFVMEGEIDQGTFYFTVTPNERNPILKAFHALYHPTPTGIIMPNVFALVPIIFHFRSVRIVTKDQAERFQRAFLMKLRNLIDRAMEKLMTQIKVVEKWTDVVTVGQLTFENTAAIAKFEYGEVIRGVMEILVSEMIMETMAWEHNYGYRVDVKRTDMDIMLVGTCANDIMVSRMKQRIFDTEFKVSARQWDVGLSFKRNYVWKASWGHVIRNLV